MTATVKKLPKSEVELTITVPYADYAQAEKNAMQEINKNLKVDGFRPGHIPEPVVREKVDPKTIQAYTMDVIIPQTYSKAVKENKLQVIAQPRVDIKTPVEKEGDDFVYTATVPVMPEVKVGDYKRIKVKAKEVKVSKKEVDDTINMLMARFATWKDVERVAKEGDRVEIDFEGFDQEGKSIPNTASKNHPVVLGSKNMIPGFEEAVVGMKVNDEKEFDITFPKDYHAKNMQGKAVKFKLKLGRLEEKEAQVLDEALVEKMIGQKLSPEDFKKKIEVDLLAEMKQRAQTESDNEVVQEIVKLVEVDLPETLVDQEVDLLKEERKKQVAQQGLTWEQYLSHVKKTDEDFSKDHRKGAEDRLKARLGVTHIIEAEKLHATDEEVKKKIEEVIASYPDENKEKVIEYYKEGSQGYRQLQNNLSADKLMKMFSS